MNDQRGQNVQTVGSGTLALLRLDEQCDSCGVAAKLRVFTREGDLVFCGHHANKYAEKLVVVAVGVIFSDMEFHWRGSELVPDSPAELVEPPLTEASWPVRSTRF